jgi:hypothetical protein
MFDDGTGLVVTNVDCVFVVVVTAIGGGGGGRIGGTGTLGDDTEREAVAFTLFVENEVEVSVARGVVVGSVCIVGVADRGVSGCTGGNENEDEEEEEALE